MKHCKINEKLNQFSNYKSISTKLRLNIEIMSIRSRKIWKSMNMEKIEKFKKRTLNISNFINIEQIDEFISKALRIKANTT